MSAAFQNKDRKVYAEMIKSMMIDYVVNDLTKPQLAKKYNIAPGTMESIIHHHKFREKRVQYQEKVLQKSIEKLADRQSSILNKLTHILQRQVDRIEKAQLKDQEKLIDPNRMKEVLTAFQLISKEYRLDNNKATDNNVTTIKVEMGSTPIISENHIINKDIEAESTPIQEAEVVPPAVEDKVEEKEAEIGEDDPIFGVSIE